MAVVKRVKGLVDVVLKMFVFVVVFLGPIVSVDFVGLTIYFILQSMSWNFNTFSWVLLVEGFVLLMIGISIFSGREREIKRYDLAWLALGARVKFRPPSLYEEELALILFVTGVILFFLGLIFFPT